MYDLAPSTTTFARGGGRTVEPVPDSWWYACYTRGRHEKQVALRLQQRGIECFCPVLPKESVWHDRIKRVEWPMFPSYVFVQSGPNALSRVLGTPGVVAIVSSNGAAVPIGGEEIDNVRRFAAALAAGGQAVEAVPLLEEGRRVRVMSGPFQGVEGIVIERRSRDRVLVGLQAIAQSWEVEVNASATELIPEPSPAVPAIHRRSEHRRRSHV